MDDQVLINAQEDTAFLMTDMVGSSRLWEADPVGMCQRIAHFDEVMHRQVERASGKIIRPRGEGDSHFAVFSSATDAVLGAIEIHAGLADKLLTGIELRIAIHVGTAETIGGHLYGPTLNRCARIRQAANPRQILVSGAVRQMAAAQGRFGFKDLGVHALRDLMEPEHLYQVLHPELPSEFGPVETLTNLSHNLPSNLTAFIGREADVQILRQSLEENRVVTLCGPGGVGKTRLAQQVAAECAGNYKQGVWFVNLAQTERPESVLPMLCDILDRGMEVTEAGLCRTLEHRHVLVILDNCEHLYDECRRLVRMLLQSCPGVSVLTTSRRALDVPGETIYRLGGLLLPEPDQLAQAQEFDGVRLFVNRAKSKATGLCVNSQTIPEIVDLCRKVDGLPLAIEIVAALTDALSVKEITTQLEECLEVGLGEFSDDPRQRTLASTIKWSRNLLSPDARDLLDRVAFFPNTWSGDAFAEICLPGMSRLQANNLMRELISHSLVFTTRTSHGDVRFGVLQTTRYVLSREACNDQDLVLPFTAFAQKLIAAARDLAREGNELAAHELVQLEWENLIKALELSYAVVPNQCADIALALQEFWMRGSRMPDGRSWYEKLAESDRIDTRTRVLVQVALSSLYILLGENDKALKLLLTAEQMMRPVGGYELARVLGNLSVQRDRMGLYETAKDGFQQCCIIFRDCGAHREEAQSLLNLGVTLLRLGESPEEVLDLFERALVAAREAKSMLMEAKCRSCIAHAYLQQGKMDAALESHRTALMMWQDAPNLPGCAHTLLDLVEIFLGLDKTELAINGLLIAERLEEQSQSPFAPQHRTRLERYRDGAKHRISQVDWRAKQRMLRTKSAPELISIAMQTIDEVQPQLADRGHPVTEHAVVDW